MEEKKKTTKPIDFKRIAEILWPHRKKYYHILPTVLIPVHVMYPQILQMSSQPST